MPTEHDEGPAQTFERRMVLRRAGVGAFRSSRSSASERGSAQIG